MIKYRKLMTFREYSDFDRTCSHPKYKRNITYYDPTEGWVIDLSRVVQSVDAK